MSERRQNRANLMKMLGASNHADHERQSDDYYATDSIALDSLFHYYPQLKGTHIREPACGEGHLSKAMIERFGCSVASSDLINRGYGVQHDFLTEVMMDARNVSIITNPPYSKALQFIKKSFEYKPQYIAMFLRLQFIEGATGFKELYSTNPPETIIAHSKRIKCAINGDFENTGSSAVAYAWFVWKGPEFNAHKQDTVLKWF